MNKKPQWLLIETEHEYENAVARYETAKHAATTGANHKEKLLLVHLIADYENRSWELPDVDPVEMIKIRMDDFGLNIHLACLNVENEIVC